MNGHAQHKEKKKEAQDVIFSLKEMKMLHALHKDVPIDGTTEKIPVAVPVEIMKEIHTEIVIIAMVNNVLFQDMAPKSEVVIETIDVNHLTDIQNVPIEKIPVVVLIRIEKNVHTEAVTMNNVPLQDMEMIEMTVAAEIEIIEADHPTVLTEKIPIADSTAIEKEVRMEIVMANNVLLQDLIPTEEAVTETKDADLQKDVLPVVSKETDKEKKDHSVKDGTIVTETEVPIAVAMTNNVPLQDMEMIEMTAAVEIGIIEADHPTVLAETDNARKEDHSVEEKRIETKEIMMTNRKENAGQLFWIRILCEKLFKKDVRQAEVRINKKCFH
jgi:hypothetical protein